MKILRPGSLGGRRWPAGFLTLSCGSLGGHKCPIGISILGHGRLKGRIWFQNLNGSLRDHKWTIGPLSLQDSRKGRRGGMWISLMANGIEGHG